MPSRMGGTGTTQDILGRLAADQALYAECMAQADLLADELLYDDAVKALAAWLADRFKVEADWRFVARTLYDPDRP